ncbi:MAG: carbohydrate-binding protein [Bacteroidales bacterium]|nr:carbohydrate-binding protein [Bacteroidales bacterium]
MKITLFNFVFILISNISLNVYNSYSQGYLHAEGISIVDGEGEEILLRGMGLGGWMLQEGYMLETSSFANAQHEIREAIEDLIGEENTDTFYMAWLANHVRRIDIDSLAAWGFNSVRLPMHYNLFSPQELAVGEYIDTGFKMVDSLLDWCADNEMYLILDLHAAPGGQGSDAAISDYNPEFPSLWESEENKARTADLWKTLADRYKDEEWIGGYDLINETKWDPLQSSGNAALWELLERITDSIRTVDTNHMVIIEGNNWGNDYSGFTGPWDDNLVISFHKYWNSNDVSAINWVKNLRSLHNVPVWLGETGENSNVWFTELIELMEQENIGYSFWPEKKVSSVVGITTVVKTDEYQELLDYWNAPSSHPKPSVEYAKDALMQITENLKLENCIIHRDVVDAFTRMVNNYTAIPFSEHTIPGIIYATDYDLGRNGVAYEDLEYQRVGEGTWNNGWTYRNDGVDIEHCSDELNSNGYNVGWTAPGEWIQYTVDIDSAAGYTFILRYGGLNTSTIMHFEVDSIDVTGIINVPSTGAWSVFDSLSFSNVVLPKGTHTIRMYTDEGGTNISWFGFVNPVALTEIPFLAVSAATNATGDTIYLTLNKEVELPLSTELSDFSVDISGESFTPTSVSVSSYSNQVLVITIAESFIYKDELTISYTGTSILNSDAQALEEFSDLIITNNLPDRHVIPGKIEAEDYFYMEGIQTETTTDTGGGLNIGYTDSGDFMDYKVDVQNGQMYGVSYRVAALNTAGSISLIMIDDEENQTTLLTTRLPVTGGWQTWRTVTENIELPAGLYTLRIRVNTAGFNLNWFSFGNPVSVQEFAENNVLNIFPNPCNADLNIVLKDNAAAGTSFSIRNISGQTVLNKTITNIKNTHTIDISCLSEGIYFLTVIDGGSIYTSKFIVER